MERWSAVLLSALLGAAGCAPSADAGPPLSYRWGTDGAFSPLADTSRQPPDRPPGETTLEVQATVPALPDDDPALDVSWPIPLASATVGGRTMPSDPAQPGLFPLRPDDAGKPIVVTFRGAARLLPGPIRFGSQRALWAGRLRADMPAIVVGIALAVLGALFAALSSVRRARELRALALFGVCAGGLAVGQSPVLRSVLWQSPPGWRVVTVAMSVGVAFALVRFVADLFGDTRAKLLRRGATAMLVSCAAAIALHLSGVLDLSYGHRADQVLLLALFVVGVSRIAPQARRGDRPAALFLAGFVALLALAIPDMAWGLGFPIVGRNTTPFGLLAFLVALGLVAQAWQRRQVGELTTTRAELEAHIGELQQRRDDIETLNDELRRQIEKRSRELRELLARAPGSTVVGGLAPGTLVDDRYRTVARLGAGAMGAVYEVERTTDGRHFALKVMTVATDPQQASRFAREAEVAARVKHPNVVTIVDVGVAAEGFLFLVMELARGSSLEEARASFGDVRWGLGVLVQVARGLAALHEHGVVHRDVKPSNVLIEALDGGLTRARVADLGVARDLGESLPFARTVAPGSIDALALAATGAGALTATGAIVGTPKYIAPELADGTPAGPASDVFSFGILACEVLTGAYPFPAPPIRHALSGGAPLAAELGDEAAIPRPVREALQRALAWSPAPRPTFVELERVLDAALGAA